MKFSDISIDFFENTSSEPAFLHGIIRLNAGARIVKSTIRGPLFLNKNSQIGPDVVTGKYFGMNENCFVARATVGSFGAIGTVMVPIMRAAGCDAIGQLANTGNDC